MSKVSWHLTKNINDIRNLFSDTILPYELDCYLCSCGTNKTILRNQKIEIDKYICKDCGNEIYLDANKYSNNYLWYEPIVDSLDKSIIFDLEVNFEMDNETKVLTAFVFLNIPNSYDLASDTVIYKAKNLYELQLDELGNIKQFLHANFDLSNSFNESNPEFIFRTYYDLDDELIVTQEDVINKNPFLKEFKKKILIGFKKYSNYFKSEISLKADSLEKFAFFICNHHLLDLEFYKWKNIELLPKDKNVSIIEALDYVLNYRTEKSLRKSIIENYKFQMNSYKCYDFIYIYSITKYIKDVNICLRMININLNEHIKQLLNPYDLCLFIQFLSSRFSDKQLEKLFFSYSKNEIFWMVDSITLFSECIDYLDELNIDKCKYDTLHSDIVNYHKMILNKHIFEIKFKYQDKFLKACTNIENYEIQLPKNGIELYDWSNKLQNCLSGYWQLIKGKKTTIYGFLIDNEIKFAVEIKNNKIVQSKSKYNANLQNKEMSLVVGWFKEYFETKKSDNYFT